MRSKESYVCLVIVTKKQISSLGILVYYIREIPSQMR